MLTSDMLAIEEKSKLCSFLVMSHKLPALCVMSTSCDVVLSLYSAITLLMISLFACMPKLGVNPKTLLIC